MKQLIQPNANIQGQRYLCLSFARRVFNISPKYSTATEAWEKAKHKHTDNLPDVAVPVWFRWTGTVDGVRKNWGHVAVWVPGRGVVSSPSVGTANPRWVGSVDAMVKALGNDAKYLGWSEDINEVRVAEPTPPPAPSPNPNMPAVKSRIQLIPVDTRTTWRAGTADEAGKIRVVDNSFIYTVRGYDSKYPYRILINSASAGGNGVGLALYYNNGKLIPGWRIA